MKSIPKQTSESEPRFVTTATVESADHANVMVRAARGRATEAVCALPGYVPRQGDRVLVARTQGGEQFIVGVTRALREAGVSGDAVVADDGARAAVEARGGEQVLTVRDGAGELLFEHRAGSRKSVVHVPDGDLEFRVDRGRIAMSASDGVSITSGQQVAIDARHEVRLANHATATRKASSVVLDAHGMKLASPSLDARADEAELAFGDARLVARSVSTAIESVQQVLGVVEIEATRIVERARNVYREVQELSQTRAGRLRMVAQATMHLFGKRMHVKGEDEVKIKSQKIYLD